LDILLLFDVSIGPGISSRKVSNFTMPFLDDIPALMMDVFVDGLHQRICTFVLSGIDGYRNEDDEAMRVFMASFFLEYLAMLG